jgi:hypothetical protein
MDGDERLMGENPFRKETWNLTGQIKVTEN